METLARHHVTDGHVLDELSRLFARTTSLAVQRAIAEIFIRADRAALATAALLPMIRLHRLPSPNGDDLIDTLVQSLLAS